MKHKKNPAAVALGKLGERERAKALTLEEQSAIGKLANAARNHALSKAERSELARKAAAARWPTRKR